MLEAFITNLGRYNEGYLDGAYLTFGIRRFQQLAGTVAVVLFDAFLQVSHEHAGRIQLRFHDVPPIRENNGACSPRSAGRGQSGKSA